MRGFTGCLLAAAASLGLLRGASAADLPTTAPAYKAPAAVQSSWNGAYLGVSLGARWSDPEWETTCLTPGLPGTKCPASIAPGRYAAGHSANFDSAGLRAGGYLGYNWQVLPTWVVGIEGDVAWGDNKKTIAGIPGAEDPTVVGSPGADSTSVKQGWDASLRLRAGYLISPTMLIYATGGVAFTRLEATVTCGTALPVGWCLGGAGNVGRTDTQSTERTGWTVGGGLEAVLAGNWLLRAEYRYADYGTWNASFMQDATNVDSLAADIRLRTHTAQVGIAYRFTPY